MVGVKVLLTSLLLALAAGAGAAVLNGLSAALSGAGFLPGGLSVSPAAGAAVGAVVGAVAGAAEQVVAAVRRP